MDSITKHRLPWPTLRAMAVGAYGADLAPAHPEAITELGFGQFNAAYRLTRRDGVDVVLKIAPPPEVEVMTYEIGAMTTELAALRLIDEQTAVPVPAVHFSDPTHELCPSDYFFMSHLAGDNLAVADERLPAAERDAYGEALGVLNREINTVRGPGFGPLVGPLDRDWRTAFGRMVAEVLDDARRRQVDLGWDPDRVARIVDEHAGALDEVVEPRLVEWDLWRGNALIHDGRIVGILDHERAFWGDPLMEHGFNGLAQPDFGDPGAFVRGYGRPPLTASELVRRRLYGIHVALIMVVETAFRAYADDEPRRWARAQLDHVLTSLGQHP